MQLLTAFFLFLKIIFDEKNMRTTLLLSTILLATITFGQTPKSTIDLSEYMKDLTKSESDGSQITMSIWMPSNYWDIATKNNPDFDKESIELLKSFIGGYTLMIVYSGKMDIDKQMFVSESETKIRNSVSLEYNNKKYKAPSPTQLPDELAQLSQALKPAMTQMFGSMGPGMNFFFFDIRDGQNNAMIDPYKDTDFKITVDKESFNYNLPAASLFEDKECEKDGEKYPSNYNYCPIHGNKLN
jgi:hypothetical protein